MEQEECDHLLGLDDYGNRIYVSDSEDDVIIDYFLTALNVGQNLRNGNLAGLGSR